MTAASLLASRVAGGVSRRRPLVGRTVVTTAFLSPAVILIGLFALVPLVLTFWISFHTGAISTPISQMSWAGLSNYQEVFSNPTSIQAFENTGIYVGLSLVITLPLAFLIALLVYQPRLRGSMLLRVILFSTYVIPTVAIVIIWSQLYSPQYGPINVVLHGVGLPSPAWLSSPNSALISLVIFNVWQMIGYYVVLLVAGLTQIPPDVYEAAAIDGAGAVRRTTRITMPLLRNTFLFVGLMTVINSIQVFDPIYLLTQGGPADSTLTISYDIQRTAVEYGLAGQSSAMAVSLLVVIAVVGGALSLAMRRRSQ
ncbi:MAG TPA: sugar ABC transporter permease [Trebonia sp.]|jgi:ABC-type sugar transport system permease subunit|nr:sugar ABC transporter permease [Trebonia sp.]